MSSPSEHFTWSEFACKDGTEYPHQWREHRGRHLGWALESFRAMLGHHAGRDVPLTLLSAYRTREWNRKPWVRGVEGSQHVLGRAADPARPKGIRLATMHEIAVICAKDRESLIRGVGLYPWGVHLDIRPGGRLAVWSSGKPAERAA